MIKFISIDNFINIYSQIGAYHAYCFPGFSDFCLFDIFKADCQENEIVFITEAQYGRMKRGRCLTDSPGGK